MTLRAVLSALSALALLGGLCEAQRVTTGTTLTLQGQRFIVDAQGTEFPHFKFDQPVSPTGGPWTVEECRQKALMVCKPGTALSIALEQLRICWVSAQSFSDFVNTTGAFGFRGFDSAVLPIVIVNPDKTGNFPLYVFNVITASTAQPTTAQPTTAQPTTAQPTTAQPTTAQPATAKPTAQPSSKPTAAEPTAEPSTRTPSAQPSTQPSTDSTAEPTAQPSTNITFQPTAQPINVENKGLSNGAIGSIVFASSAVAAFAAWRISTRPSSLPTSREGGSGRKGGADHESMYSSTSSAFSGVSFSPSGASPAIAVHMSPNLAPTLPPQWLPPPPGMSPNLAPPLPPQWLPAASNYHFAEPRFQQFAEPRFQQVSVYVRPIRPSAL
jgi:hypothetical protein